MEIFEIAEVLRRPQAYPAVLGTLVSVEGSSYRRVGARLLLTAQAERFGSISGGCLESDLALRAQLLMSSTRRTDLVEYDTTGENDLVWGVGTGCHGVVRILLERIESIPAWAQNVLDSSPQRRSTRLTVAWGTRPGLDLGTRLASPEERPSEGVLLDVIPPPLRMVIFGAGDDTIPLTALCRDLGWVAIVIDPRPEMATPARFPAAQEVRCFSAEIAPTQLDWDDRTVAVIMTHHYRYDLPLLQVLGKMNLTYLGLLGPKQRGLRLLRDAGLPANCPLHSPVGLDLGGDGPAAVALSIIAEIQAHLHGRTASNLTQRTRSIHAD